MTNLLYREDCPGLTDYQFKREQAENMKAIQKEISAKVLEQLTNFINVKYNVFEKSVQGHSVGVQRVYDEMQVLSARMFNLERDLEHQKSEEEEVEEEIELETCPFCDGPGNLEEDGFEEWFVRCDNCAAQSNSHHDKADAIEAWNQRS